MGTHDYDPSGAGRQRFSPEDYLQPPQDSIPEGALFGLWDFDNETWLGAWYFTAAEAQQEVDRPSRPECNNINWGVISVDGWEYFNPSGF